MSSSLKLQATKKKYTQHDLRRLMHEQKSGSAPKTTTTKIDSPLAKYNDLGQLMCILCKSVVRSEDVWKVHINAKQHKQYIELAKQLKEKTKNFTTPSAPAAAIKRPAPPLFNETPPEQIKGILKNATPSTNVGKETPTPMETDEQQGLPNDFFDEKPKSGNYFEATLKKTSIKRDLISIKRGEEASTAVKEEPEKDETLPEGFFDDPKKDAKARNSEYKDPAQEEWDKFQHEIKEASDFSNAIIAEDQEEAITERQIDEIDEQMHNWNRVLTMEKKKEDFSSRIKDLEILRRARNVNLSNVEKKEEMSDHSGNENDDIDEFLDWRSKKAYK